jgi:hypothetical protein
MRAGTLRGRCGHSHEHTRVRLRWREEARVTRSERIDVLIQLVAAAMGGPCDDYIGGDRPGQRLRPAHHDEGDIGIDVFIWGVSAVAALARAFSPVVWHA